MCLERVWDGVSFHAEGLRAGQRDLSMVRSTCPVEGETDELGWQYSTDFATGTVTDVSHPCLDLLISAK